MSATPPFCEDEAHLQIESPDELQNSIVVLVTGANT